MSLIIVAIDGSEQSRRALEWAVPYAAARSAAVQAVTVVDTAHLDAAERAARVADAERMLARLVGETVDPSREEVSTAVIEGDPTQVLVDATARAELIVFGSHRMSSLRNPALGTVSLACIRSGSCPVLVIPPPGVPDEVPAADLVPA